MHALSVSLSQAFALFGGFSHLPSFSCENHSYRRLSLLDIFYVGWGCGGENFPEAVGLPSKQEFRRDGKSLGCVADVGGVQAALATQ